METVRDFDNLFLDTSVYDNKEVLAEGLNILGPERIVYGSDQPYNLIRGQTVFHPVLGRRTVTDNLDYHWVDRNEQLQYRQDLKINPETLPNMHFSALNALITAIETVFPNKNQQDLAKQKVFYDNAATLTGEA